MNNKIDGLGQSEVSVLRGYALQVRLYIFAFIEEADDLGS